ncbi:MAG TPA: MFS transporter [Acidimicrobiales bacterium]|nr:MFS transporter [Acidimicrobiales bacterium]
MTRVRAAASGTFRSLHNRNYRLFFGGQLVSLVGTWMQTVALAWLVLKITHSPAQVGLIIAVQFIPTLLGGMHGGLVADRFDKRKVLLTTQALFLAQAVALSAAAVAGLATLPVLYALALVLGAITAVDNPARQAFVAEMVPSEDVPNAVGLNSAMFNTARIVGPAIGGILIDLVGTTTCFMLNAVSFIAVIAGLLAMRPAEFFRGAPVTRQKGALREGLRYTWADPTLRLVMVMVALIGTLAMNFSVLLPVLAKQVFHGSAATFGMLSAVIGVGSLFGALAVASRATPTVRLLTVSAGVFGVAMLLDAFAPTLAFEVPFLVLTGVASVAFFATANATLQLKSRPELRGRVLAIYLFLFLGSTPIGGPIVGWISGQWSARWGLAVGGAACLVATVVAVPAVRGTRVQWRRRESRSAERVLAAQS